MAKRKKTQEKKNREVLEDVKGRGSGNVVGKDKEVPESWFNGKE